MLVTWEDSEWKREDISPQSVRKSLGWNSERTLTLGDTEEVRSKTHLHPF